MGTYAEFRAAQYCISNSGSRNVPIHRRALAQAGV
jgi:hypothetical protein